jgi:hypothetical protein
LSFIAVDAVASSPSRIAAISSSWLLWRLRLRWDLVVGHRPDHRRRDADDEAEDDPFPA